MSVKGDKVNQVGMRVSGVKTFLLPETLLAGLRLKLT